MTLDPTDPAELLAKLHADSRIPPADQVGKVKKFENGPLLDYLGHAAVTDILLAHDPEWYWEPFAVDDNGLPKVMYDAGGKPRALWIRLTIHGHTRIGIGTCSATAFDPYKELIGDALRNAAMRFGVAVSLWAKEEWQESGVEAGDESSRAGERSLGTSGKEANRKENVSQPGNVRTLPTPSDDDVARHPSNGPSLPPDQALAVRADQLGLTEDERRKVYWEVARAKSGKDIPARLMTDVFAGMERLAEQKKSRGKA